MKRFLLFAGREYEAGGGWRDFIASYVSREEARAAGRELGQVEWFQIVDLQAADIVEDVDLLKERQAAFEEARAARRRVVGKIIYEP